MWQLFYDVNRRVPSPPLPVESLWNKQHRARSRLHGYPAVRPGYPSKRAENTLEHPSIFYSRRAATRWPRILGLHLYSSVSTCLHVKHYIVLSYRGKPSDDIQNTQGPYSYMLHIRTVCHCSSGKVILPVVVVGHKTRRQEAYSYVGMSHYRHSGILRSARGTTPAIQQ